MADDKDLRETDERSEKLERQLEAGALFTHTGLGRLSGHINEIEAFLFGVIDLLIEKGFPTGTRSPRPRKK